MDWVTLRTIHRKLPFKPYKIHTSAGDQYRVPSPESMSVLSHERAIVVQSNDGDFDVVDLANVTAISPLYPGHTAATSESD